MSKSLSIFKVGLYNVFNINKFKKHSLIKKIGIILLILYVSISLMFSMGFSSLLLFEKLKEANMMFLFLPMFLSFSSILVFMSTIRTSKANLYDSKDKDLLLSFPLKTKEIVIAKILDMYIISLILSFIVTIPTFVVYIYNIEPSLLFIVISFISLFFIPIVPMIIGGLFGYIIARTTPKSNKKNIIEILLSFILIFGIILIQFNMNNILNKLISNGDIINKIIKYVSYPSYLLNDALMNGNALSFIYFVLINVCLLYIFVSIINKTYLKLISKSSEFNVSNKKEKQELKSHSLMKTLIMKESNKFISSPIYITNSIFGIVILFVVSCATFFIDKNEIINSIGLSTNISIIHIIIFLYIFSIGTTNITASSISIEGSKFWILKSLPIKEKEIIYSKILFSIILVAPVVVLSSIMLYISLGLSIIELLLLIIFSILYALVIAKFGMLINLKFPKMDAINEQVVVKQSMSSFISTMTPMFLSFILVGAFQGSKIFINLSTDYIIIMLIIVSLSLNIIFDLFLKKWAVNRVKHIY